MKQLLLTVLFSLALASAAQAQELTVPLFSLPLLEASSEAQASMSASVVSPEVKQIVQEKKDQDVTETTGGKTDALAAYLLEQPETPLSWHNFIRHLMRRSVSRGLPSNLIVLLILFPIVSLIIAFSRHVVGLRGFGVYTPAVLSVALVSTGIINGIILFLVVILSSMCMQKVTKRLNLAHLPKTSLVLWGVSLIMILFLLITAYFDVKTFFGLSIFPLLIVISLSENFTSTQLFSTTKEAVRLTFETIFLASISALIIDNSEVQRLVITHPELTLLLTLAADMLIGRYNGLRLLELWRFKTLIQGE